MGYNLDFTHKAEEDIAACKKAGNKAVLSVIPYLFFPSKGIMRNKFRTSVFSQIPVTLY